MPVRVFAWICLCLVLIAGCRRGDDAILARIGDEVITADEFVLNYEFGHGHLRAGDDPKRDYLQFLIYEALFAREAATRRFDTLPAIRHAMHTLEEELLIERVFEEHVLSTIEVTDEEIRTEINRDAVSFRFRLLPAGSEAEARRLREAILASSFDEVMEARLAAVPELRLVEGQLNSPYVRAEDLDPAVLDILKDLPVNQPSEPRFYRGAWYIFEVQDIRRQRLSEDDYRLKAPSYRKILYNRKAMEGGTAFVARTMEPLGVTTKRAGFEMLHRALFQWYSARTPERNLLHYIEEQRLRTPYTQALIDHYAEPLVEYRDARWTIRDFLAHFTPGRYVIRPDDEQAFKARLADVVALVVRDAVLLNIARKEKLDENEEYRRSIRQWKNKWLFQEYRNRLVAGLDASVARARLRVTAESLMARTTVQVNWTMLDTLQTSVSKANPTMTVHLFKNNANKMPFPIVDPNWRAIDP